MSRARTNRKKAVAKKKQQQIQFKKNQTVVVNYDLGNGYEIRSYPVVEKEYTEEDRLRDEERARENAYFRGYDFCWISRTEYEEIWRLLTDNYTRQIPTEGFGRFSFGSAGEEDDWVVGTLAEEKQIDYYSVGTNAYGDIIFAGDFDYSYYHENKTTLLPYGIVFDSSIEMKFWPAAPFSSDGPKLIEWLKKTNEVVKLDVMPLTMEFIQEAVNGNGWVKWAGVYRRDDALLRLTNDGIEFCGDFGKQVDATADLITDADKVEALLNWIYEGGQFPLTKETGTVNE